MRLRCDSLATYASSGTSSARPSAFPESTDSAALPTSNTATSMTPTNAVPQEGPASALHYSDESMKTFQSLLNADFKKYFESCFNQYSKENSIDSENVYKIIEPCKISKEIITNAYFVW